MCDALLFCKKKKCFSEGIEVCQEAIILNPKSADAHKWLAILVGSRTDYQPVKERVADGNLFKKHLDIALELSPKDYTLHHMLGRYLQFTTFLFFSFTKRNFQDTHMTLPV